MSKNLFAFSLRIQPTSFEREKGTYALHDYTDLAKKFVDKLAFIVTYVEMLVRCVLGCDNPSFCHAFC